MKQNLTNQLFTLILGRLLSLVAKVSQVSFCRFHVFGELCHEIVFLSCQKEVRTRWFVHPHPLGSPPQRLVNLKADSLPGNQLEQS